MKLRSKFISPFLFVFLVCLLCSCGEEKTSPGIVATVNGEPITLHDLQILMDSRYASLGMPAEATFEGMREGYGKALAMQIANTLVRQELERQGLSPTEEDVNQALERISSEYGDGNLDGLLDEALLNAEDWRQLMRDHLALEVFRNQILLPGIKIEFQDVKNYYQKHKKDFVLPETVHACFLASKNLDDITGWCKNISANSLEDDDVAQCVEIALSEIPQPWNREMKSLKSPECGKPRQSDGEWQAIALLDKKPERIPELSEVFPLVEKLLLEPRQNAAFDQWLEENTLSADVRIAPDLHKDFIELSKNSWSGEAGVENDHNENIEHGDEKKEAQPAGLKEK